MFVDFSASGGWLPHLLVDPFVVFPGTEDAQIVDGGLQQALDRLAGEAAEYDAADDKRGWAGALTDFAGVAVQLGLYDVAERSLTAVLTEADFTRLDDDVVAEARMTLANLYCATGHGEVAEKDLRAHLGRYPDESFQAATFRESLGVLYAESQREHLAIPELRAAIRIYQKLGESVRLLEAQASLAWVLLATGDDAVGSELLFAVRAQFVQMRRPERVAACDYNWANFLVNQGRFDEADEYFAAAATGLTAAGMHHQLANLQWNRVRRLKAEAQRWDGIDRDLQRELRRDAADTAISALIAGEYERLQFDDVGRRINWMRHLSDRTTGQVPGSGVTGF
ncbi:hypothetical protein [Gordonia alkaliphila]|uniref:Tetratricopeptide repeat protein n=1 Tax=Gordonia alkaliphila TaxID=1053547 RepID=A0ABP8ZL91_9ACTN